MGINNFSNLFENAKIIRSEVPKFSFIDVNVYWIKWVGQQNRRNPLNSIYELHEKFINFITKMVCLEESENYNFANSKTSSTKDIVEDILSNKIYVQHAIFLVFDNLIARKFTKWHTCIQRRISQMHSLDLPILYDLEIFQTIIDNKNCGFYKIIVADYDADYYILNECNRIHEYFEKENNNNNLLEPRKVLISKNGIEEIIYSSSIVIYSFDSDFLSYFPNHKRVAVVSFKDNIIYEDNDLYILNFNFKYPKIDNNSKSQSSSDSSISSSTFNNGFEVLFQNRISKLGNANSQDNIFWTKIDSICMGEKIKKIEFAIKFYGMLRPNDYITLNLFHPDIFYETLELLNIKNISYGEYYENSFFFLYFYKYFKSLNDGDDHVVNFSKVGQIINNSLRFLNMQINTSTNTFVGFYCFKFQKTSAPTRRAPHKLEKTSASDNKNFLEDITSPTISLNQQPNSCTLSLLEGESISVEMLSRHLQENLNFFLCSEKILEIERNFKTYRDVKEICLADVLKKIVGIFENIRKGRNSRSGKESSNDALLLALISNLSIEETPHDAYNHFIDNSKLYNKVMRLLKHATQLFFINYIQISLIFEKKYTPTNLYFSLFMLELSKLFDSLTIDKDQLKQFTEKFFFDIKNVVGKKFPNNFYESSLYAIEDLQFIEKLLKNK